MICHFSHSLIRDMELIGKSLSVRTQVTDLE